ncbi:MAG: UDP-2,3-diacylglucosamine diphosphatase [Saprospiraceae bacterium]|nr:UDP-2,3-diacylglucosamine diphosphatase [Saprospiraceae bacterium]
MKNADVVVISDVHLGTYGCQAEELLYYLRSIRTNLLIINGDFIDGWNFSKSYFPESHFEVLQYLLRMIQQGTKVIYVTGNHDEFLRKYSDLELGNLCIVDKFILEIDDSKYWFFHGDVFDFSTQGVSRITAKIGGKAYDLLIVMNKFLNKVLIALGKEKYSLSKKIKNVVKNAIQFINNFEEQVCLNAIEHGYDYVVCGHIHCPKIKKYACENGEVVYMNSGDWVENLSALEYINGEWRIFNFPNRIIKPEMIKESRLRNFGLRKKSLEAI